MHPTNSDGMPGSVQWTNHIQHLPACCADGSNGEFGAHTCELVCRGVHCVRCALQHRLLHVERWRRHRRGIPPGHGDIFLWMVQLPRTEFCAPSETHYHNHVPGTAACGPQGAWLH